MRPAPESLTMDREILAKKNRITITNNVAIFLLLAFFGCIVATALLVFYLAPCPEGAPSTTHLVPQTSDVHGHTESPDYTTLPTEEYPIFTTAPPPPSGRNVRLPRSVHPVEYDLWIQPFNEEGNFTFQGEVEIILNVTEATGNITLHANELEINESSVTVLGHDGTRINSLSFEIDKELQFFIIELGYEIEPGNYSIKMNYNGVLNDVLQGFYRSSYQQNNSTRWIAGTQFQPTDARRAFPCFDEPAFKAKFTIHITGDEKLQPISNMPLDSVTNSNSDKQSITWYNFKQSVPMSTYLVAFVVQDFVRKGTEKFAVYVRRDASDQVGFSIDIGPKLLTFYENYFNITFPLPKIYMVAMPDFSAGAMENWGLITFRESALLYEEGVSPRINKQRIATVIAHELAHQWFGNLVTPTWWTDLWLNEGFASYLEYIGTNAIHPNWKVLDQFVVTDLQSVFSLDALKSSHQISVEVNNPDEINYIFDKISYSKGATIIRMMEQFLTEDVFKTGLTNYLNANKFGNAQQDDLWKALTDQAHKDKTLDSDMTVKEIMDTWTLQVGFPVINATRNYKDGTLQLSQSRFFLNANVTETNPSLWWVPISYTSPDEKVGKEWLRGIPEITINTSIPVNNWLLVNVNQTGYYRVNYDLKNWELITKQLTEHRGHFAFDPKNRAQIIDDAFNLANVGLLNYTKALSITSYLTEERELVPWKAAFVGLDYLYEMFLRRGNFNILKEYMLSLIIPSYRQLGFRDNTEDTLLVTRTRFEILLRACRLGYSDCIKNAAMQFQNWLATSHPDKHNPISPNLKGVVYCTAIRVGGEAEWNFAWERYLNTNVATEKELLLGALACTREAWLLNRYLDLAVTEGSGIRRQDAGTAVAAISRNIIGQPLAFRFLTSQFERIKLYLGSSFLSVNSMIRSVTLNFNTEEEMDDLKNFARKQMKDLGVINNTINQSLEKIEANIQWMSRNYKVILDWLEQYNNKKSRR